MAGNRIPDDREVEWRFPSRAITFVTVRLYTTHPFRDLLAGPIARGPCRPFEYAIAVRSPSVPLLLSADRHHRYLKMLRQCHRNRES